MTESFSHWMFRGAAATFAIFFAASLWPNSLKVTPTHDDLEDRRFEMRMVAQYDPHHLFPYGVAMAQQTASPSLAKNERRTARHTPRFHLPTPATLPH